MTSVVQGFRKSAYRLPFDKLRADGSMAPFSIAVIFRSAERKMTAMEK